jgi:hypothetical protein
VLNNDYDWLLLLLALPDEALTLLFLLFLGRYGYVLHQVGSHVALQLGAIAASAHAQAGE